MHNKLCIPASGNTKWTAHIRFADMQADVCSTASGTARNSVIFNTCLLESTMAWAQAQLTSTASAAKDLGLIISVSKTEYMTENCNPSFHFKSLMTPSTMLLTSNILAPKLHQLQMTSNDTRCWHGVLFGNWKVCGKVLNYPFLRK